MYAYSVIYRALPVPVRYIISIEKHEGYGCYRALSNSIWGLIHKKEFIAYMDIWLEELGSGGNSPSRELLILFCQIGRLFNWHLFVYVMPMDCCYSQFWPGSFFCNGKKSTQRFLVGQTNENKWLLNEYPCLRNYANHLIPFPNIREHQISGKRQSGIVEDRRSSVNCCLLDMM